MVDIFNKKCKCHKIPYFNEPGEKIAIRCMTCKTPTMINVRDKRCDCGEMAFYNVAGQARKYCKHCKTSDMIDVVTTKCACGNLAVYNVAGQAKKYCGQCKTSEMVDVINKKCKSEGCETLANKKYKNYCTTCFQHLFPTDPLTFQIRCKTKEIAVRDFINQHFDGFVHDRPLYTSHCDCTVRRRIDHRKLIGNTLLVVETDENQHKSYDAMDEEIRYDDLYMAFAGKWVYIRFNPDKYKVKGKNKNPEIATRLEALQKELNKQIARIQNEENTDLVERVYMYYDE